MIESITGWALGRDEWMTFLSATVRNRYKSSFNYPPKLAYLVSVVSATLLQDCLSKMLEFKFSSQVCMQAHFMIYLLIGNLSPAQAHCAHCTLVPSTQVGPPEFHPGATTDGTDTQCTVRACVGEHCPRLSLPPLPALGC